MRIKTKHCVAVHCNTTALIRLLHVVNEKIPIEVDSITSSDGNYFIHLNVVSGKKISGNSQRELFLVSDKEMEERSTEFQDEVNRIMNSLEIAGGVCKEMQTILPPADTNELATHLQHR